MRTVTEFCGALFPKGQAIEELSDHQLVQINWYLNSRPLKCLNWHTTNRRFFLLNYVIKFVFFFKKKSLKFISCNLPYLWMWRWCESRA